MGVEDLFSTSGVFCKFFFLNFVSNDLDILDTLDVAEFFNQIILIYLDKSAACLTISL